MGLCCLQAFIYAFLIRGIHSVGEISWLPCTFKDEITLKGPDTKHVFRQAVLQFGQKGDPPLSPGRVTFIITASKLDIRQSLGGAKMGDLTCELSRHSTDGSHVRWPVRGEHEYNRWFILRIKNSKNLFNITAFIRQSTDQPPTGQHDYKSWTVIQDTDVLTTSVVLVLQTQTPVVKSPLNSQPELHCQFDIDHKAPKVTVRWQKLGDRTFLFNHDSLTGLTEGSGVSLQQLAAGGATYTVPISKVSSEGKYWCSVHVPPLEGKVEVDLQIEEPPRVSLNVDPTLTLSEGKLKRVVCWAESFYPLDVDMQWSQRGSTDLGPRVDTPQYSSHISNPDGTFSLSASFNLQPKLQESGRKFTCSVSHRTLPTPIRETFTLIVTEPGGGILVFNVITLVVVVVLVLRKCLKAKSGRVRFF